MIVTLTLVKTVEPVLIYSIDIIVHVQLDIPEEIALRAIPLKHTTQGGTPL